VSWLAVPDASGARVAYTVGRRAGGAVQRNRLRRRLRPVMAQLAPHLRPGDYLLGAGSRAAESSPTELADWVGEALERAGALHGPAPLVRP